jgi:hypothetical protein
MTITFRDSKKNVNEHKMHQLIPAIDTAIRCVNRDYCKDNYLWLWDSMMGNNTDKSEQTINQANICHWHCQKMNVVVYLKQLSHCMTMTSTDQSEHTNNQVRHLVLDKTH